MYKNNYQNLGEDSYYSEKKMKEEDKPWEKSESMEDIVENIDSHKRNISELKHECHTICSDDYNDFQSCHDFCERIGV